MHLARMEGYFVIRGESVAWHVRLASSKVFGRMLFEVLECLLPLTVASLLSLPYFCLRSSSHTSFKRLLSSFSICSCLLVILWYMPPKMQSERSPKKRATTATFDIFCPSGVDSTFLSELVSVFIVHFLLAPIFQRAYSDFCSAANLPSACFFVNVNIQSTFHQPLL